MTATAPAPAPVNGADPAVQTHGFGNYVRTTTEYLRPSVWHDSSVRYLGKANQIETATARKTTQLGANFLVAVTSTASCLKDACQFVATAPVVIVGTWPVKGISWLFNTTILNQSLDYLPSEESVGTTAGRFWNELVGIIYSVGALLGEIFFIGGSVKNFEYQQRNVTVIRPNADAVVDQPHDADVRADDEEEQPGDVPAADGAATAPRTPARTPPRTPAHAGAAVAVAAQPPAQEQNTTANVVVLATMAVATAAVAVFAFLKR